MDITTFLKKAIDLNASDLHITPGFPPVVRISGYLQKLSEDIIAPETSRQLTRKILGHDKFLDLETFGEIDFSFNIDELGYFRANIFKQTKGIAMAVRIIPSSLPSIVALNLPEYLISLTRLSQGLILITGAAGSGKSTTLTAMINQINNESCKHIITIEDPIEYIHENKKSIITQREVGRDSKSFPSALRAALRQDPDVILLGETRDLESIAMAITAAETGHLVMATLHTSSTAQAISRIIDVFPSNQQEQIRLQLANSLKAVINQRLIKRKDKNNRIAIMEILVCTSAIANLIRDNKIHQINSFIQTGSKYGMQTFDGHLQTLYEKGYIDEGVALANAENKINMADIIDKIKINKIRN